MIAPSPVFVHRLSVVGRCRRLQVKYGELLADVHRQVKAPLPKLTTWITTKGVFWGFVLPGVRMCRCLRVPLFGGFKGQLYEATNASFEGPVPGHELETNHLRQTLYGSRRPILEVCRGVCWRHRVPLQFGSICCWFHEAGGYKRLFGGFKRGK